MDLKRLRYFCAILEQGSISKAAQSLHIAQPPLSKRLQELEEELGTPLLLRHGRGMRPTEAGLHLYQRASQIFRNIEDTRREIAALGQLEKKVLRIGLSYLFQRFFQALLLDLHQKNPDTEINISVSDSSHLELLLNQGNIDLALMQKPTQSSRYETLNFSPIPLVAVISKSLLPEPPKQALALETIAQWPLILLRRVDGIGTYELILEQFRKRGFDIKIAMHISDPAFILQMLEAGMPGATLLPRSEVKADQLHQCTLAEVYPAQQIFFPALVKLVSASDAPQLLNILRQGYPPCHAAAADGRASTKQHS